MEDLESYIAYAPMWHKPRLGLLVNTRFGEGIVLGLVSDIRYTRNIRVLFRNTMREGCFESKELTTRGTYARCPTRGNMSNCVITDKGYCRSW